MSLSQRMQSNILRLQDPVILPEYGIAVGLTLVAGAGSRVGVVGPTRLSHYSIAQARRLAAELAAGPQAEALKPAIDALCAGANALDQLKRGPAAGRA